MLQALGVEQALTSGYHPESNGQTERVNQVLEQYLRCYINYQQTNWVDLLPLAEFAYNNSVHASSGMTPFHVVYGSDPVAVPSWEMPPESPTALGEWSQSIAEGWPLLVQTLEKAKAAYKKYADRKRSPTPKWGVGDGAYLSTKNLRCIQASRKLAPRYVGPFKIIEVLNEVTVRLQLPKNLRKVHNVFRVSMLKKVPPPDRWRGNGEVPETIWVDGEAHQEVREIVDSRWLRKKLQYLIEWKHFPVGEREWVDACHVRAPKLVRRFHASCPEKPVLLPSEG